MQSSDSSALPQQLRLLGFLPWPGTALAIAGETRSPRFRRAPFVRDVAIDPGRASAPRVAVPHILPSTMCTASAPTLSQISWLIPTPHTIAVYAYMSFAESSSLCENVPNPPTGFSASTSHVRFTARFTCKLHNLAFLA